MHVIFVEPAFPRNQREFPRALKSVGAHVTGIGEAPIDALDDELKSWLDDYVQVRSVVHEPSMLEAVRHVQGKGWVDRLEATVEAHILPAARVREQCRIPGTSARTAFLCRDKPSMKEALRQAGVPCAQSIGTDSPDEVREFVRNVGYPVILKPRDGAGAAGATRCDDDEQLEAAMRELHVGRGANIAVEEFVEGHEGFYDTLTVNGQVTHEFVTHYYPGVLEAMRTRWISPQFIATNRVDRDGAYDEVKEMGRRVISALGLRTSATHMEWFFGPKGLKFSEIGCRPPGVGAWDLYCHSNEMDVYAEWAHLVVHGCASQRASRGYAAGLINLRPNADGRIQGYQGIDEVLHRYRDHLIDHHLPPAGTRTQPVEAGYMANAWIRMKARDYDELRGILDDVGRSVHVIAG